MKRVSEQGYTVLEVMIVMAVSVGLFMMAVIAFNGRQQEVQFNQAVRDFDSRLQDIMNDVSTGVFGNDSDFECVLDGSDRPELVSAPGAGEQGESDDCVFVGNVIQFQPQGTDNEDRINVIDVLGRRYNDFDQSINYLSEANPAGVEETIRSIRLDWGLRVTKVFATTSAGVNENVGAIGFFTAFTTSFVSDQDSTTVSSNQLVEPMPLIDSNFDVPSDNTGILGTIEAMPASTLSDPDGREITICLQKADQSKRAAIVIGKDGSNGTTVQFDTNYDPECDSDA